MECIYIQLSVQHKCNKVYESPYMAPTDRFGFLYNSNYLAFFPELDRCCLIVGQKNTTLFGLPCWLLTSLVHFPWLSFHPAVVLWPHTEMSELLSKTLNSFSGFVCLAQILWTFTFCGELLRINTHLGARRQSHKNAQFSIFILMFDFLPSLQWSHPSPISWTYSQVISKQHYSAQYDEMKKDRVTVGAIGNTDSSINICFEIVLNRFSLGFMGASHIFKCIRENLIFLGGGGAVKFFLTAAGGRFWF